MFTLISEHSFDAAHFLSGYNGKCSNIHGHRWRVVVEIFSDTLLDERHTRGMVVDFDTLKEEIKEEVDYFDHSLIIEKGTLREKTYEALTEEGICIIEVDFRSTAENFARYFYMKMKEKGYQVKQASVYETPNNCATYSEV
ncbi:MAG: 6-carboxytetrahydropterin synthase [Clostridiales bacterium]|nr:6-carboxytetrahydropterin synthase [Clostridiales bacterium]